MRDFQVSAFANFFMVGIDHKSAALDIREKFSLGKAQKEALIADYQKMANDAILVISTCNRTEIYAFGNCPRRIIDLFCRHSGMDHEAFFRHQNIKQNREAIEHLYRVASGLESKILGDFEIVGQVKKAFQSSKKQNANNAFLERLVNSAVQTSKRVKNDTKLSEGAASVAFAAVQEIKRAHSQKQIPKQPHILLFGLGKIGKTTCENLVNQTGFQNITVINRTGGKAEKLADKFGVEFSSLENLSDLLDKSDVTIVATGAEKPTVGLGHFSSQKKRLILDLSVPRNVAVKIYKDVNFRVVDIDQLSSITKESQLKRELEVPKAEMIITEMTNDFYDWLESRRVAPTLQAVRKKLEIWKEKELKILQKKSDNNDDKNVDILASQIINKITGQFARHLREGENTNADLRTIHRIFGLEKQLS